MEICLILWICFFSSFLDNIYFAHEATFFPCAQLVEHHHYKHLFV